MIRNLNGDRPAQCPNGGRKNFEGEVEGVRSTSPWTFRSYFRLALILENQLQAELDLTRAAFADYGVV
jgi:hypothetical protein